jgi:hypothetical protein
LRNLSLRRLNDAVGLVHLMYVHCEGLIVNRLIGQPDDLIDMAAQRA